MPPGCPSDSLITVIIRCTTLMASPCALLGAWIVKGASTTPAGSIVENPGRFPAADKAHLPLKRVLAVAIPEEQE